MNDTPTHGFPRVRAAFSESFAAAANKNADNLEFLIKLADKKVFRGRFVDRIPSHETIKKGG